MKKVIAFNSASKSRLAPRPPVPGRTEAGQAATRPQWGIGPEQQMQLLNRLLGCSDRYELIERFVQWTTQLALAEGVAFRCARSGEEYSFGNRRHHCAHYDLVLDHAPLGEMTLCRRERYSEDELMVIEQALAPLARCLQLANEVDTLRGLATCDPLTGLGNRRSFDEALHKEALRAQRHDVPLALMMIDIDHFKVLNDRLGHTTGDHILRTIADTFRGSTRASDLLFRFGGDEFAILLPHTELQNASVVAELIRLNLGSISDSELMPASMAIDLRPDLSIGIAAYQNGDCKDTLVKRADAQLYQAKAMGRGRVCSHHTATAG